MKFRITKENVCGAHGSGVIYYIAQEIDGAWNYSELAFSLEDAEYKLHKAIERYKRHIGRVEVIKEIEL